MILSRLGSSCSIRLAACAAAQFSISMKLDFILRDPEAGYVGIGIELPLKAELRIVLRCRHQEAGPLGTEAAHASGLLIRRDQLASSIPGGFSGNGSAKLKLAPRRILIFLACLMLRRDGVSFWLA